MQISKCTNSLWLCFKRENCLCHLSLIWVSLLCCGVPLSQALPPLNPLWLALRNSPVLDQISSHILEAEVDPIPHPWAIPASLCSGRSWSRQGGGFLHQNQIHLQAELPTLMLTVKRVHGCMGIYLRLMGPGYAQQLGWSTWRAPDFSTKCWTLHWLSPTDNL